MMKVLSHGDQVPWMTQSIKINAHTVMYLWNTDYSVYSFLCVHLHSCWVTGAHASQVQNHHQVSSTSHTVFCISKTYFYFSLVPIATRIL